MTAIQTFDSLDALAAALRRHGCITMLLGYGRKSCYADRAEVERILRDVVRTDALLYFGDPADEAHTDIGWAVQQYAQRVHRSCSVYMVQVDAARGWGVPEFVNSVYWHSDFQEGDHKWGGVDAATGEPQSNTKVWVELFKKHSIEFKAYVLGGGPIATQERRLLKQLHVPHVFIPMRPLY